MLRMKKTIKLGGVAFAAMLALAPVVSSNVVQADTSKPAVQATKRNKMKTKCAPRLIFVYDKDGNFAVSNYRYVYFKRVRIFNCGITLRSSRSTVKSITKLAITNT